jgi:hypothetical protein
LTTIALKPILDRLMARPPLNLDLDQETEARLPAIVGGLKNPRTEHWQRAFKIFDLLL